METEQLEKRLQELSQQFANINAEIENTANLYNKEIERLEKEGQNKINALIANKERVSGAYTELSYLLHPELKPVVSDEKSEVETPAQVETTTVEPVETVLSEETKIESIVPEEIPSVTIQNLSVAEETQEKIEESKSVMTTEELQKVQEIMNATKKETVKEVKEDSDIPEYLKEEYNK